MRKLASLLLVMSLLIGGVGLARIKAETDPAASVTIPANERLQAVGRLQNGDWKVTLKDKQGRPYTGTQLVLVAYMYNSQKKQLSGNLTGDDNGTLVLRNSGLPGEEANNVDANVTVTAQGTSVEEKFSLKLNVPKKQAVPTEKTDQIFTVEQNADPTKVDFKTHADKFNNLQVENVKSITILGLPKSDDPDTFNPLDTSTVMTKPVSCRISINYNDGSKTELYVKVKVVTPSQPQPQPKADKAIIPDVSNDTTYDELFAVRLISQSTKNYVVGSNDSLDFRFAAQPEQLLAVYLDGNKLSEELYTVTEGSTIISLKNSILDQLKTGKHTLTSEFLRFGDVRKGRATFYVSASAKQGKVGKTGELAAQSGSLSLIIGLIALGLAHLNKH